MDARFGMAATTFEPPSDLIQEEDCNTLLLYLPGFTKDQLKVQLNRSKVLIISGSRPIGDNKLSSFQKEFPVSENIDTNKITAKFEDGILYIRQPKVIVPADKDDQKIAPLQPHKPTEHPPKMDQRHEPSAAQGRSHVQGTGGKHAEHPLHTDQRHEPSAAAQGRSHVQGTGGIPAEHPLHTDQRHEPSAAQERSHKQGTSSGSAPAPAPKTTPNAADINKHTNLTDFTEKSKEKKEEKPTKKEEKISESEGGKKHKRKSDADRDQKAAAGRSEGDKPEKISGTKANAAAKVDDHNKVNAAALLKMARAKMMKVLLYLLAFALGAYVSRLRWASKEVGN